MEGKEAGTVSAGEGRGLLSPLLQERKGVKEIFIQDKKPVKELLPSVSKVYLAQELLKIQYRIGQNNTITQ